MKRSKLPADIFLIHAHQDRDSVHKLYQRLLRDGMHVWLDVEDLQPGQDWQNEIRNALLKSDVVIVCLTKQFDAKKGYRHEELKLALEKSKLLPDDEVFIIPVRLEACDMPDSLGHLHRVDLFEEGGYKKLLRALRKLTAMK
ncbi:MAG: hypothetical protein C3F07_08405 [Anaerolineales bacterium]|nr:toll/interleukin-1 receptor domain-containing protein [Anaerolineae bacterium]PWB74116.1 MAG: hypothetical protein C3F07_08405 [Anaerolineales bacterium]